MSDFLGLQLPLTPYHLFINSQGLQKKAVPLGSVLMRYSAGPGFPFSPAGI